MKTVYMITSGDYLEDYIVHRIYENIEDAERFCAIQNAHLPIFRELKQD